MTDADRYEQERAADRYPGGRYIGLGRQPPLEMAMAYEDEDQELSRSAVLVALLAAAGSGLLVGGGLGFALGAWLL